MIHETAEQTALVLKERVLMGIDECYGGDSPYMLPFYRAWNRADTWEERCHLCCQWMQSLVEQGWKA